MKKYSGKLMKQWISVVLTGMLVFAGCGNKTNGSETPTPTAGTVAAGSTAANDLGNFEEFTDEEGNVITAEFAKIASIEEVVTGAKTEIKFSGSSADISGTGCSMKNGILMISSAGTYVVSGVLSDGYICIDTDKNSEVNLVLNGVEISNDDNAAIFVKKSQQTNIYLAEGTTNTLTDGAEYIYASAEETEPNAALYSKSNLTISGKGTLIVNANYNDGIAGKDSLALLNGDIQINAAGDGIVGKDYLYVTGGTYRIVTGKKALKSDMLIQANGGSFRINSCDDAIHSQDAVVINGGSFEISSGDDGVHAETELFINGGEIDITQSYEGIEALDITINGGEISIVASDDGINAAGTSEENVENQDNSKQGFFGGRGGMGGFGMMEDTNATLTVHGGYLRINAVGDGLDANGGITITGGEIYVDGPVNNGNGSLDYATTCIVTGGILVAVGSSGMSQAPGNSSSQPAISYTMQSQPAGTIITVKDAVGTELVSHTSAKSFQNVVISAPGMVVGETCTISIGDESTELELTGTVTYVGTSGGMGGFGGGMGTPPDGQGGGFGGGMGTPPDGQGGGFGGGMGTPPDGQGGGFGGGMRTPPDGNGGR